MTFDSAPAGAASPVPSAGESFATRSLRGRAATSLLTAAAFLAAAIGFSPTASAQVGPAPGVAVQVEKYSGAGVVVDAAGMQFRFQDDAGQEYAVSASPERVFGGMRYGQIDPLEVRIRGTFDGDRLEPGMVVAFHAMMSGRRVVEPVERLTIVTPGPNRPLGIHDPEALTDGAIFGLFLGKPLKVAATDDAEDGKTSAARGRNDRDAPTPKVVIGQVTKATGLDRFTVAAGEKIDVGASLQEGALLFVDSASIAHLTAGDPVKLEGAKVADGALFAVKVDVERAVPPELLARPEEEKAEAERAGEPATPVASTPATPAGSGSGVKPPASGVKPAESGATPAVRGRIVEVN
jgi:hypothetical protein